MQEQQPSNQAPETREKGHASSTGKQSELEALYLTHGDTLRNVAKTLPIPTSDREDVCQDVWLHVLQSNTQLLDTGSPAGYLITALRHRTIDLYLRQRSPQRRHSERLHCDNERQATTDHEFDEEWVPRQGWLNTAAQARPDDHHASQLVFDDLSENFKEAAARILTRHQFTLFIDVFSHPDLS